MTIQNTTIRKAGPSQGNGVTTVFPFTFKVFTATDILVTYLDALAVESVLVLSTNYTVSLNADQNTSPGGSVTLLVAPATATYITLTSQVTNTQTLALTNSGGFYPESINNALDRTVIEIQQLAEKVDRAVKVPQSSSLDADSLLQSVLAGDTSAIYTPLGTGAVTRTVASKLNDTVSVKDFGAVGNGVTNDTAAIQAAINACFGKTLYFPSGRYLISSTLTASATTCVNFLGDSRSSCIIQSHTNAPMLKFNTTGADIYYAIVSKLMFLNDSAGTTSYGIQVMGTGQFNYSNFNFCQFAGTYAGIFFNATGSCSWNTFDNLLFTNTGLVTNIYNIYRIGNSGQAIYTNNTFIAGYRNIHLETGVGGAFGDFIISGNNFEAGSATQNIWLNGTGAAYAANFAITGNKFDVATTAIALQNCQGFRVLGNAIGGGGFANAVSLTSCTNYIVDESSASKPFGIRTTGNWWSVSGNVLLNSTGTTSTVANRTLGVSALNSGNLSVYGPTQTVGFGLSTNNGRLVGLYSDNGTAVVDAGNITVNGATASFNGTSDYRLKENVTPIQKALETVNKLNPVDFTWKEGFAGTNIKGQSFLAHELQEIMPLAVVGEKDAVDADGKPIYQAIDQSKLVALLTAAVKELSTEIVNLQNSVATLR